MLLKVRIRIPYFEKETIKKETYIFKRTFSEDIQEEAINYHTKMIEMELSKNAFRIIKEMEKEGKTLAFN